MNLVSFEGLSEGQFKRAPNGWFFTTSHAWLFWRWQTFLISDAQKPAFDRAVRLGTRFRLITVFALTLLLTAVFVKDHTLMDGGSLRAWMVVAGFFLAVAIGMHLSGYLPVRKLLAEASRTNQTVTRNELFANQTRALPIRSLKVLRLIFIFGAVGNAGNAFVQFGQGRVVLVGAAIASAIFFMFLASVYHRALRERAPG